jgi:hypothetical protein
MLNTLKSMRAFCDQVPWSAMNGPEINVESSAPPGTELAIFSTAKCGIAWVRLPIGVKGAVSLRFPDGDRPSRVRYFDVAKGAWIADPAGVGELAVAFER